MRFGVKESIRSAFSCATRPTPVRVFLWRNLNLVNKPAPSRSIVLMDAELSGSHVIVTPLQIQHTKGAMAQQT